MDFSEQSELFETDEQKLERKLKEAGLDICNEHTNNWSTIERINFMYSNLIDIAVCNMMMN